MGMLATIATLTGVLASGIIHGTGAFCMPGQSPALAVSAEVPLREDA